MPSNNKSMQFTCRLPACYALLALLCFTLLYFALLALLYFACFTCLLASTVTNDMIATESVVAIPFPIRFSHAQIMQIGNANGDIVKHLTATNELYESEKILTR